jgi:peptidoglycan/xylan/chitin deacetylase (PgdA/CDA1 family)
MTEDRDRSSTDRLASTLEPFGSAGGNGLEPEQRQAIEAWSEREWRGLEARAGRLAERVPSRWYALLSDERWRDQADTGELPPAALKIYYRFKRLVPRRTQLALRRFLIRRQGRPAFPSWPIEEAGATLLRLATAEAFLERDRDRLSFPWFWPGSARAAVVLSHDIESATGFRGALEVASWEEEHGLRSSFNVVADEYPVDSDCLEELRRRGHEIGSHAIHHDRSLFSSRREFDRQVPLLRRAAEELGAVGFRSPATHRVSEWLSDLPFAYDCTVPHSDPYEPIPGGAATLWPFFHGQVVELPYTAPQDHTLFNLLGHRDAELWLEQLERVAELGGMFQTITHPDPEYLGRPRTGAAYRDLLAAIAGRDDLWVARGAEVAEWWRRRARGETPAANGLARWTPEGPRLEPADLDR